MVCIGIKLCKVDEALYPRGDISFLCVYTRYRDEDIDRKWGKNVGHHAVRGDYTMVFESVRNEPRHFKTIGRPKTPIEPIQTILTRGDK
jgi:hypothetical protein